jgi:hypothetical protein
VKCHHMECRICWKMQVLPKPAQAERLPEEFRARLSKLGLRLDVDNTRLAARKIGSNSETNLESPHSPGLHTCRI